MLFLSGLNAQPKYTITGQLYLELCNFLYIILGNQVLLRALQKNTFLDPFTYDLEPYVCDLQLLKNITVGELCSSFGAKLKGEEIKLSKEFLSLVSNVPTGLCY